MNKKYAIFDMDGTLVNSMYYWKNLVGEFLSSKGITEDLSQIMSKVKTMTIAQSTLYFSQLYPSLGSPQDMAGEALGLMDGHYRNDIELKPGIKEYLEKLKSEGVKMCIATITDRCLTTICLQRLGIFDYFDFIITSTEVKTGKNTPDMYLLCAEKLGSQPNDTAVFEDTLNALTTAKEAGFYTIGIYDESEAANTEKIKQLADEYIDCWKEMI